MSATCDSRTPILATPGGPEVHGLGTDATIYGLLMAQGPLREGEEVKIVWRMTGQGALTVTSISPSNTPGVLTFGPTPHTNSSYARPGDEWGTGFLLDQPGCWRIHLQRAVGIGDVWINVAAGPA